MTKIDDGSWTGIVFSCREADPVFNSPALFSTRLLPESTNDILLSNYTEKPPGTDVLTHRDTGVNLDQGKEKLALAIPNLALPLSQAVTQEALLGSSHFRLLEQRQK